MTPQEQSDTCAGAPGSIRIGEQTYLVGPAAHSDLVAVRARLKKVMRRPLDMLQEMRVHPSWTDLPEDLRYELQAEAARSQLKGELVMSDETVLDLLQQPEHCAFLAYVLIRKQHPAVKLATLRACITDDNADVMLADLFEASGLLGLAKNLAGRPGSPTTAS